MKRKILNMTPAQLGIDDADMKAALNTTYSSDPIPFSGFEALRAVVTVDNTGGGAAGTASLQWQMVGADGADLGTAIDLITGINTKTDCTVVFRVHTRVAASVQDSASAASVGASADTIYPFGTAKLILKVTEQQNGTTCTADVTLYAEG